MALRFYFGKAAGAVSPTPDGSWEDITQATTWRDLPLAPDGSAFGNFGNVIGNGVNPNDVLIRPYVSAPLAYQIITGTFKGQTLAVESNAALNARIQCVVRVVSNDGLTIRGTLVASVTNVLSSEFNVSKRNVTIPLAAVAPITVTSVTAQAGDRIAIELGIRVHGTDVTSTAAFRHGGTGGVDLPEDETTVLDDYAWAEFSQTLIFQSALTVVNYIPYKPPWIS